MRALLYLVNISLSILLGFFLLRLLLQLAKANFRNPLAKIVTQVSDPLVLPLRKVFPPLGKVDSASVIACVLASLFMVVVMLILRGQAITGLLSNPLAVLWLALRNVFSLLLSLYWLLILFSILLSWMRPGDHSPLTSIIHDLTEPLLAPVRRLIPPFGGLDLSPIPIILLISALQQQFSFTL